MKRIEFGDVVYIDNDGKVRKVIDDEVAEALAKIRVNWNGITVQEFVEGVTKLHQLYPVLDENGELRRYDEVE